MEQNPKQSWLWRALKTKKILMWMNDRIDRQDYRLRLKTEESEFKDNINSSHWRRLLHLIDEWTLIYRSWHLMSKHQKQNVNTWMLTRYMEDQTEHEICKTKTIYLRSCNYCNNYVIEYYLIDNITSITAKYFWNI